MLVNVNGCNYDVRFGREKKETNVDVKNDIFDTFCSIANVDESKKGKDRFDRISFGEAHQSVKDKYNKVTGKKIALSRALKNTAFSKTEKKMFWDEFVSKFIKK